MLQKAFPAHAGMNRDPARRELALARVPRTRGDEPRDSPWYKCTKWRSPHTRG